MSAEALDRALGYPYPIPPSSYVVHAGTEAPFSAAGAPALRAGRTAVLAVGSNQSPLQIGRKFAGPNWSAVPCERCTLQGFDTVYSAHITAYGSIAAALHPSPGTRVSLFVNWLDDAQLERMHETETVSGNYDYARLNGIRLVTEHGLTLETVTFYRSTAGALAIDGTPVPLAEIAADGRRWPAMTQQAVQETVRARTDPALGLAPFILSSIDDPAARARRRAAMAEGAVPFHHPAVEILKA